MDSDSLHQLGLIYLIYLFATASPGPSNLSIMGVAMHQGRSSALVVASGVLCGSLFWAILAATGVSALLTTYANAIFALKICGGAYLLYLALKSAKSALTSRTEDRFDEEKVAYRALFCRGAMMHLTNPKAILAWVSIMSLGLQQESSPAMYIYILAGCIPIGMAVFMGYALVFSTRHMVASYKRLRRWIEGTIAIVFAGAGVNLLLSRN